MAVVRGTDGVIEVSDDGGTTYALVASQQTWSIDQSNDTIDTTVLGAQRFRSNLTTFFSWSATVDGFWDTEDQAAAQGQGIINAAAISGDKIHIKITPNVADSSGVPKTGDMQYEGECTVTSNNPSGGFDTAVQLSMAFEGTGELTYAAMV